MMNTAREPEPLYKRWMLVTLSQGSAVRERCSKAKSLLNDLKERDFDSQTLKEILILIDFECLCRDIELKPEPEHAPKSELDSGFSRDLKDNFKCAIGTSVIGDFADKLSSCLVRYIGVVSKFERELQCRALLSVFALLRLHGVTATQADADWRPQIKRRFQDLIWLPGEHQLFSPEVFYRVQCSHLLSLVAAYAQQFPRAETKLVPVLQLTSALMQLGVMAAGTALGSGVGDWLGGLQTLESSVSQLAERSNDKYFDLFKIQALTRVSLTLQLYWRLASSPDPDVQNNNDLARRVWQSYRGIAQHALRRVLEILNMDENRQFEMDVHRPRRSREKLLALLNSGPTTLDRYHYFYGLLDCASQLCGIVDSESHPAGFAARVKSIIMTSKEDSFRWKALEIMLVCADLRSQQMPLVREEIENDNSEAGQKNRKRLNDEIAVLSRCLGLEGGGGFESRPAPQRVEMSPKDWKEEVTDKREHSAGCEVLSLRLPRRYTGRKIQFSTAGLSSRASHAYFLNDDIISVYSLKVEGGQFQANPVFQQQSLDARFCTAAISESYVVVLKEMFRRRSLHLFRYNGEKLGEKTFESEANGHEWNPTPILAIHETNRSTLVAIGGSTKQDDILTGSIKVFLIDEQQKNVFLTKHTIPFKFHKKYPSAPDLVKTLEFSPDGRKVVCATSDNRILVWRLSDSVGSNPTPFIIERDLVTDIQGGQISSTSLFTASSSNSYVLCTTSPSFERVVKDGEWSFLSPIGSARDCVPNNLIHELVRLGKRGPIIIGAVSPGGRFIALVEDIGRNRGKLIIMPVVAEKDSGLSASEPVVLEKGNLSIRSFEKVKISPTAVRFHPENSSNRAFWLVAVDIEGRVIKKYFAE